MPEIRYNLSLSSLSILSIAGLLPKYLLASVSEITAVFGSANAVTGSPAIRGKLKKVKTPLILLMKDLEGW